MLGGFISRKSKINGYQDVASSLISTT